MSHPQIDNIEAAAAILDRVPDVKFVFTGGATIALYLDVVLRDEVRPTKDVDCVVEIFSRADYYRLTEKLRTVGLEECAMPSAPLCRWQYDTLLIDVMPCDDAVLGFSNRWYVPGLQNTKSYHLPSGRAINLFSSVYLLASKVEAFMARGNNNFYYAKDIEDIIILLDGCEELERDVATAEKDVQLFLQQWFQENLGRLEEAVLSCLPSSSQNRETIVLQRIERLARR